MSHNVGNEIIRVDKKVLMPIEKITLADVSIINGIKLEASGAYNFTRLKSLSMIKCRTNSHNIFIKFHKIIFKYFFISSLIILKFYEYHKISIIEINIYF